MATRPSLFASVWLRVLVGLLVVVALGGSLLLDAPYYVSRPGPVVEVDELVDIAGLSVAPLDGDLLLLTVQFDEGRWLDVLAATFDPELGVVSDRAIFGDEDPDAFIQRQAELFTATAMTAGELGIAVSGAVGVDAADVVVDEDDGIGGPSAGLAIALTVADLLDPDDLVAGRRIAVTGAITDAGEVEAVGGIADKVEGAVSAGADLLVVPSGAVAGAEAVAGSRLSVIGVDSLQEAVDGLRG